jgi:hypothetical protein
MYRIRLFDNQFKINPSDGVKKSTSVITDVIDNDLF